MMKRPTYYSPLSPLPSYQAMKTMRLHSFVHDAVRRCRNKQNKSNLTMSGRDMCMRSGNRGRSATGGWAIGSLNLKSSVDAHT
jgi:hypothetical protein